MKGKVSAQNTLRQSSSTKIHLPQRVRGQGTRDKTGDRGWGKRREQRREKITVGLMGVPSPLHHRAQAAQWGRIREFWLSLPHTVLGQVLVYGEATGHHTEDGGAVWSAGQPELAWKSLGWQWGQGHLVLRLLGTQALLGALEELRTEWKPVDWI